MTTLINLFAGGWNYILAGLAFLAAIATAWWTSKKVTEAQEQAKADVAAATKETKQAQQSASQQTEIIRVVKDVEQKNANSTDSGARERMRESKYHSSD